MEEKGLKAFTLVKQIINWELHSVAEHYNWNSLIEAAFTGNQCFTAVECFHFLVRTCLFLQIHKRPNRICCSGDFCFFLNSNSLFIPLFWCTEYGNIYEIGHNVFKRHISAFFFFFYITGYSTIGEHTSCVPEDKITLHEVSSACRWLFTWSEQINATWDESQMKPVDRWSRDTVNNEGS